MTLAEKIKAARLKAGLSQKQLADMIGVKPQNMCGYEKGVRKPKMDKLKLIAEATKTDIVEFLDI